MDGLDLIARCRAQGSAAPVLILSARRSVDERVKGLEQGGDDYLTKPFALAELLARLRNLLRRSSTPQKEPLRLEVADLQVVDVHIFRLRSKVDHDNCKALIHTIRGVGYVLKHG